MNFQKTTQYAIKTLSHMALAGGNQFTADQLSDDTNIPKRYLRRLMTELSKAGFLTTTRGRTGGFTMARDLSGLTLYEIVNWFEQESFENRCILGFSFCVVGKPCLMHDQWVNARNEITRVLKETTLGSLKDKHTSQIKKKTKKSANN